MYAYTFRAAYDGKNIVVSDYRDGNVWVAKSGQLLLKLKQTDEDVANVAISPDGKLVATGPGMGGDIPSRHDNATRIWNLQTGKVVDRIDVKGSDLAFSMDGKQLLIGGSSTNSTWLWDLDRHRFQFIFPGRSAQFSTDGTKVLAGDIRQIVLWDLRTLKQLRRIECPFSRYFFDSMQLSKDGRQVLVACSDYVVRTWDTQTGALIKEFQGHTSYLVGASFSAKDESVVSGAMDGKILVWDVASGQILRTISCKGPVEGILVSPNGRKGLALSGQEVAFVDIEQGKILEHYSNFRPENEAAFSPDCKTFVVLRESIEVYDTWNGKLMRTVKTK